MFSKGQISMKVILPILAALITGAIVFWIAVQRIGGLLPAFGG
jgi:uncharacterized protein (UPF0333 family)